MVQRLRELIKVILSEPLKLRMFITKLYFTWKTGLHFEHKHDWFVVTLFSSAFIQDSDQDWLRQFQKYGLNERQLKALVHIKHSTTGINNSEYRELNNMTEVGDDRKTNSELVRMVQMGILQKVGADRNRRYVFVQI